MSRLPSQSIPASNGTDLTSDPVLMSLGRARALINWQIDRPGIVHNNISLVDQLTTAYPTIDGIGYYYNAAITNIQNTLTIFSDLVMWAAGGFLFFGKPADNPITGRINPNSGIILQGSGITGYSQNVFFIAKRVRFIAYGSELIMVQDGGLLPIRMYATDTFGSGLFRAGIEPPTNTGGGPFQIPAMLLSAQSIGGVGIGPGTWKYKLTFADERLRESSPTEATAITLLTGEGTKVQYRTDYFRDSNRIGQGQDYGGSNLRYAYLYRNIQGVEDTFYQIARATIPQFPVNPVTFVNSDFYFNPVARDYDDAPDNLITASAISPNPGENDPPDAASVGTVYRNHVVLNDVNDANTIQISNLSSTVQYALIPTSPLVATDGLRAGIGTDQGNVITAFEEFGSYLAIFKRRGCYFLSGNNLTDFNVQPMHTRGCIAPDSCVRCDNVVMFLSEDGVYAASYQGGEVVQKISKEIEAELLDHLLTFRENAVGWFFDNSYHLAVEATIYVYNFDAQGWTTYVFGSGQVFGPGEFGFGEGVPPTNITSNVGFNLIGSGSAAAYGAFVPNDGNCGGGNGDGDGACDLTVIPTSISATAGGGSFPVTILAQNDARIGYGASDAWLSVSGPSSGSGTATVIVAPNTACMPRSSLVTICDKQVTVTQAQLSSGCCSVTVTPTSISTDFNGGSYTLNITLLNPEIPSASADKPWIHVGPYTVVDSTHGTILVTIDQNNDCDDRNGNVMVCSTEIPVNQGGNPDDCPCDVTLSPSSATFAYPFNGTVNFAVIATNTATNTPISTDVPGRIINILAPLSGSGPASFDCDSTNSTPPWEVFDAHTFVGHVTICDAVFSVFLTHS